MDSKARSRGIRCAAAFAFALLSVFASAQTYPTRPIRLIVPYGAGTTDLIARMVNVPLGERLGQPIVVDNRPGAATVIGAEIASRAPAPAELPVEQPTKFEIVINLKTACITVNRFLRQPMLLP